MVCALAAITLIACGGDEGTDNDTDSGSGSDVGGGSGSDTDVTPGATASATISAAEGGELELGGAALTVPPGALATDTELTVAVVASSGLPDADTIAAPVYDFGPDGQTFDVPVSLRIEFDPSGATDDTTPKMAYLEDGTWHVLSDSRVEGGAVVASTTHFTPFTIILAPDGQISGSCDGFPFTECGGDLVGTWEVVLSCFSMASGNDPFDGRCPEGRFIGSMDLSGTVSFTGSEYTTNLTRETTTRVEVPLSCVEPAPCEAMGEGARQEGDKCVHEQSGSHTEDGGGPYSTDGTTIVFGEGEGQSTATYCVSGDSLTIRIENSRGEVTIYKADRVE